MLEEIKDRIQEYFLKVALASAARHVGSAISGAILVEGVSADDYSKIALALALFAIAQAQSLWEKWRNPQVEVPKGQALTGILTAPKPVFVGDPLGNGSDFKLSHKLPPAKVFRDPRVSPNV